MQCPAPLTTHGRKPPAARCMYVPRVLRARPKALWHRVQSQLAACKSTPRGFEPLRAEPNGFRVHLLSRSDTVSCMTCGSVFVPRWTFGGTHHSTTTQSVAGLFAREMPHACLVLRGRYGIGMTLLYKRSGMPQVMAEHLHGHCPGTVLALPWHTLDPRTSMNLIGRARLRTPTTRVRALPPTTSPLQAAGFEPASLDSKPSTPKLIHIIGSNSTKSCR